MSGSPAAPGRRGPRGPAGPWIAILALALLARLALVALAPPRILWPDGLEYQAVARSLLEHGTYGLQTLRPPGYPTLIAGVYAVFGENLLALRLVEAVLGAASVALLGIVGAATFGNTAGFIAGALMALHPVLAFLPSTQYSENTLVLVLVAALAAVFSAWRRGGPWRWALAGGLFGVAALVRPTTVFMLPGLGLGLLLAMRGGARSRILTMLVAVPALLVTVAPWIVRGHRVQGEWYFIASGGGRQFWVGNNARATAETSSPTQWNAAERESLFSYSSDIARERWHYREGLRFVRAEPARAARLYLKEITNLFALWPETFSRAVSTGQWGRWAQGIMSLTIFVGAAIALARMRAHPLAWPLFGAVVSFALASAAFFTVMRYRMVIEPCLLWLAGVGWASTALGATLARRLGLGDAPGTPKAQSVKR
jgi:4-amino-4-deoxy-L-arabinose transferase-like glycosyltransferase